MAEEVSAKNLKAKSNKEDSLNTMKLNQSLHEIEQEFKSISGVIDEEGK